MPCCCPIWAAPPWRPAPLWACSCWTTCRTSLAAANRPAASPEVGSSSRTTNPRPERLKRRPTSASVLAEVGRRFEQRAGGLVVLEELPTPKSDSPRWGAHHCRLLEWSLAVRDTFRNVSGYPGDYRACSGISQRVALPLQPRPPRAVPPLRGIPADSLGVAPLS